MIQYYHEMLHNNSLSSFPPRANLNITSFWLAGFTEGDGCFSSNKLAPILKYENHIKESPLFLHIQHFFSQLINFPIGNFTTLDSRPNLLNSNPTVVLEFNQITFLKTIIIPFFQSPNLFHTKKIKDFNDWSTLVHINYYGYHLLSNGIEVINLLKSRLNNFRLSTHSPKDYGHFPTPRGEGPVSNIDEKIVNLLSLPSPYEIKNGIRFLRNTDKLVSKKFIVIDENQNKKVYTSLSEACKIFNLKKFLIKDALFSGKSLIILDKVSALSVDPCSKDAVLATLAQPAWTLLKIKEIGG
jgi:hypothetical protein